LKKVQTRTLFAAVTTLILAAAPLAAAPPAKSAAPGYDLKGRYFETCACKVSCPCASNATLPTEGHCDAVSLIHIDTGTVEQTKLDGLTLAIVMKFPDGAKAQDSLQAGKVDLITFYIDEAATPAQRAALDKAMPALFGPMDKIQGYKAAQWVPMTLRVEGDKVHFQVADGSRLAFDAENLRVGDQGKIALGKATAANRIMLTNSAPFPWVKNISQGIGHTFHYDDLGSKWDYTERNAFFGDVAARGSLQTKVAEATR
jgi:hypothetical protein